MATIIRNKKPLAQRPLKTSQATGASLATMGIDNSIPLMHGSQGCGAFAKVYLIQHFREPMPIQNTAIDHISAVMGGDESIQAALALLCEKHQPKAITLMSTGLTEVQGTDLERNVKMFRQAHPEFADVEVISVPTPDFVGSLQSGFALTVERFIKQLLLDQTNSKAVVHAQQVNVLCSPMLTAADIDLLKQYLAYFGLTGIFVPDLSLSLDGHLARENYSATSTGGCSIDDIKQMNNSIATIVLGESLLATGKWLEQAFDIPCYSFASAYGMQATDDVLMLLQQLSGKPVPPFFARERQRLQDTFLDVHFVLSAAKVAMALEPDWLVSFSALLAEVGCEQPLSVTTAQTEGVKALTCEQVIIGDHSDLDSVIDKVDLLIGNTHCAEFFEQHKPVYRAGYPCHDTFGNSDRLHLGYAGARACLNSLANLVLANSPHGIDAYQSPYRFSADQVVVTA